MYDYTSQSSEELSFKENEVLTLFENDDADWFVVENSKGEFGLAPSNYVQQDIAAVKEAVATKDINPGKIYTSFVKACFKPSQLF